MGRVLACRKDGTVYFVTSDSSLLHSLNAASGAVEHSLGLNHWYLQSSPALASNILYVGSTQGKRSFRPP